MQLRYALFLAPLALGAQDYSIKPWINPVNVYAGYTLTMRVQANYAGKADHIYLSSLGADNPAIAVAPYCGWANPNCWQIEGKLGVWNTNPTATFDLQVTPAATVKPGAYSVNLVTTSLGMKRNLTLPVRVLAVPAMPDRDVRGGKAPNLPGLGRWRSEMTFTGDKFCDPKAVYAFGVEQDVWYYDGAYVFFQVYDFTHKPKWKTCALNVAAQYRNAVTSAAGKIGAWRVFTQGLKRAYEETGDASYKQAVSDLVSNSPFAASNGDPDDQAIRETAYLLRAFTDAHLMGIAVEPARARTASNYLIGMADTLFAGPPETTNAMIHQSFFDGLLAEALIYYFDNWVRDPRIPPTVGKLCNWIYQYLWDGKARAMIYNPFSPYPGYPRHCEDMCRQSERTLINLIVPAYFWYWRLTGDEAIRRYGDELFSHALDDPIDDKGKSYSQNYRWSFAGVRWRTEP